MEVSRTKRKGPPIHEHSDPKRRKFSKALFKCIQCGTLGHNASACPITSKHKNNNMTSRSANIICFNCRGIGHYASNCEKRENFSNSATRIQDHVAGPSKHLDRMRKSPRNWRLEANSWRNTEDSWADKSHFHRRSKSSDSFRRRFNKDEGYHDINRNPANQYRSREVYQRPMSFTQLEILSNSDSTRILTLINQSKKEFMGAMNSVTKDLNNIVVVVEILSKLSHSPFEESKSLLILDVCKSHFIIALRSCLKNFPPPNGYKGNSLYWDNQEKFWKNLIEFCGDIVATSPATAIKTCGTLIQNEIQECLEGLNKNHEFVLPEECTVKLQELRQKLNFYVEGNKPGVAIREGGGSDNEMKPPEDFRELSVIPTREDLLGAPPFLRPNITEGGYSDVEHYLDVQFRLLREDCFGPIRVGIEQYLLNSSQRKYDHVRVYRNVKFMGPYVSNLKVGHLIQIDTDKRNYFKRVNWAHSKRFLFGSLVIFTKDHFQNCIMGTIIDRDHMLLAMGRIPITIIDKCLIGDINSEDTYTMIESEVYFEPYIHVLRALQAPSFVTHLPMQEYIVKVTPHSQRPGYLTEGTKYTVLKIVNVSNTTDADDAVMSTVEDEIDFSVCESHTWPTKEELQFNESQYEAYKLALTHEFAVIQGPPGTGKTYVGLKVAETLIRNVDAGDDCLMLVICFTNHALDQFLEGISKVTDDIVRIGGQSRNEAMDKYNIMNIRKERNICHPRIGSYSLEMKAKIKTSIANFQETMLLLDILNNGVINYAYVDDLPEVQLVCEYYNFSKDGLSHWLFENSSEYDRNFQEIVSEYAAIDTYAGDNEFNVRRKEFDNVVNNEDQKAKELMEDLKKRHISFLLIDAKILLKNMISGYIKQSRSQNLYDIYDLDSKIQLFEDMSKYRSRPIHLHLNNKTNFSSISTQNRWSLYFKWIRARTLSLEQKAADFQKTLSSEVASYEEARMMNDMELLRNKKVKVLGMTTSGAARMRKLIHAISPKIVIVEEAAEVLEQHIITSLPNTCQHLILIGDHQQLRPSASYMKLVKKYNIEVSLFERMITNGMHSRRLDIQHRMRPEIAALISPHIYPQLENHPSVEYFGDVLGMEKNVFFFSHEHEEEADTNDASSRSNHKEGDIILALANYLIQQGYKSEEVTILAAYSGQMFYMRNARKKYVHLSNIKITVLDNYQGEESRIILLSLVRNNPENNIGFLGIENRICVALSRAKQGLYIFGNINMLKLKSELWTKIATTLEKNDSLGTSLNLKCQNHPDEITPVITVQDFDKAPEGGCTKKCNYQHSCGHRCSILCHGYDRKHTGVTKCSYKCDRIICDLNHVCPLYCREECQPCKVYVKKMLPCGHEQKVYCYREPNDTKNKCLSEVDVTLPLCGHKARKSCYMDIDNVKCKEKCKLRLENCGHTCELQCHADKPCSEMKYLCKKECARLNKGCQAELSDDLGEHQCKKMCYEQCDVCNVQVVKRRPNCKHLERTACSLIEKNPCLRKCARIMTCGHNCYKKCFERCGDCEVMVEKEIPDCKHIIGIMCKMEATKELCNEMCSRTMSCGHQCLGRCGDICDPTQCTQLSMEDVESPCGHKTKLPCKINAMFQKGEIGSKDLLKYCNNPCGEELACQHICSGSCSMCYQGRLHIPCKQTCNQLNICGHVCQEPCNQMCPPCNMRCEVKCAHSRCSRLCGEPCVPCKEKCGRRCAHGACSKLCGQRCSRAACSEPCPLYLACDPTHRCRGVCGEPCPDICNICRPEQFPTGFIGEQYEEHDKFLVLQDCGHVVNLEDMDSIMMGDQETIKMRECPLCRKPVINTNRYKHLINDLIENKINPIKLKVFGKVTTISYKYQELKTKVLAIYNKYHKAKPKNRNKLTTIFRQFMYYLDHEKKFFSTQVEMLIIYCGILEILIEKWSEFDNLNINLLKEDFDENLEIILKVLDVDFRAKTKVKVKISQQQQKDIGNEIKRLNAIIQLIKLLNIAMSAMLDVEVKNCVDAASTAVLTLTVFDEDKAIDSLNKLQTAIKTNGVVTRLKRQMIVKAVGLKAGHWFKCPNGHFYCIGECGGATVIAKCPDCGESIGGTDHTLLPSNSHAKEMDGSQFAAYSEQANNMGNFLLNI